MARSAGLSSYLKEAFGFHWNLLLLLGATAAAAISPIPDILLPLVGAAELVYLTGMISAPRFRDAIDAKLHKRRRPESNPDRAPEAQQGLAILLSHLSAEDRERFEALQKRCLEMRSIAHGIGGRTGSATPAVEDLSTPGLDRLLWVFLRLLVSHQSLQKFLKSTDKQRLEIEVSQALTRLHDAEEEGNERMVRSLRDSLATAELRLDNYSNAHENAEFVGVELDRIENKIRAISEMSINRQDPDFISREVDSVAAGLQQTEQTISELSLVTGLADDLVEPPPILQANLREVLDLE